MLGAACAVHISEPHERSVTVLIRIVSAISAYGKHKNTTVVAGESSSEPAFGREGGNQTRYTDSTLGAVLITYNSRPLCRSALLPSGHLELSIYASLRFREPPSHALPSFLYVQSRNTRTVE